MLESLDIAGRWFLDRRFFNGRNLGPQLIRNGGRDLAALQEHIAKDDLVSWGWNPGEGRQPAPGSQEAAGKLVQAWIDSGAECPQ